ncbi:MAG TPA: hypothetical protein VII82_12575 [Polyangiaceae bacterium]
MASFMAAPGVRAEPDDRAAAAQVLFESGRSLLEQGHFAEACPKFAESQRLAPGIGTMLWLADCLETSGRLASGWAAFKEAAAISAQRKDPRERIAQERAAALEPRLSKLNLIVGPESAAPGLEIRRDGMLVGGAEWGLPVPLDPGVHSVAATAPGRRPWSTTVEIRTEAEVLPVTIPVLQIDSASASNSNGPDLSPNANRQAAERASTGKTQRTVGLAIGGAGVVSLVIGTVAAISAKTTYDDSNSHCNASNECDAVGKQDRSSAISRATVASVALGAGAAALVGGGIVYFTAPVGRTSLAVAPSVGGGLLRFDWTF